MLIKYYTTDERTIILDNISDVHINSNPAFGDFALDPWVVYSFDEPDDELLRPNKVITFAKDGPCVLYVFGTAYVCNDEGKTIEKVIG